MAISAPLAIASVNRALAADRQVVILFDQKGGDEVAPDALARIGTMAVIRQMARGPVGLQVLVEGLARIRVEAVSLEDDRLTARITALPERVDRTGGGGRACPPGPRARRSGVHAVVGPAAGAARHRRRHRRSAATLLSARQPSRHEAARQATPARGRRPRGEAERPRLGAGPRGRAARNQGTHRVEGPGGDVRDAEAVLPASAVEGDPDRARRD